VSDTAIPFSALGKGTYLMLGYGDLIAIENTLGCSYEYLNRPGIFGSLTSSTAIVWRGLKQEDQKTGKLVHVFSLDPKGHEEAGELVFRYLQGGNTPPLSEAIAEALLATGLWKRKAHGAVEEKTETPDSPPKNSVT